MLTLTMMNDSDIAKKFKATIRILFIFDPLSTQYSPSSSVKIYNMTNRHTETRIKPQCIGYLKQIY